MTLYVAARILHIAGAFGIFMTLGVDLAGISTLARARTTEQVQRALEVYRINGVLGPLSLVLLLVPGFYLAAQWGWPPWVRVAFMTLLLIVVVGAVVTRRSLGAIGRRVQGDDHRLDTETERRLRDPILRSSFVFRAFLAVAIAMLMTVKPDMTKSLLIVGAAVAAAAILSVPLWMSSRSYARA